MYCNHGVVASGGARSINFLMAPLTYDEELEDGTPLTRESSSGPHITNLGFYGNGYDSHYYLWGLPDWTETNLYLQASIKPLGKTRNTIDSRDVIVSVGGTTPKIQFAVLPDPVNTQWLCVGFRGRNTVSTENRPYVRRDWRFEGRFPVGTFLGNVAIPQSICFNVADDYYTVVAHLEDADSVFVFQGEGSTTIVPAGFASHFSSLARDQSGNLWALDYADGTLYRLNESSMRAGGAFSAAITYDFSAIAGAGAIEFITYSGTDYILVAQYLTSGTPYVYAVPVSEITNGGVFVLTERYKRFVIQFRCQGLALQTFSSSTLYLSSNRINTESAFGRIYTVDIAAAMAGSDGATLSIVSLYQAPSQYPEDLDFDSTGRLWTLTEGQTSVNDDDLFLSIWSTDFTPQENHFSAYYNGSSVSISINGYSATQFSFVSGATADRLEIGGPSIDVSNPAWDGGYFIGYVKNVYVSDEQPSADRHEMIREGDFETKSLTVVPLTVTNPGAESGTTGWTNEVGAIATRSANPEPHTGSAYFSGGSNAQTIARQSIDLLAASGLDQTQLNARVSWVTASWYQASFGGTDTDTCGLGLAFTDGGSESSRSYSALLTFSESQIWFNRSFSKQLASGDDAVRLVYRSDRSNGTNNDGYVDSIAAVMYLQEAP